MIMFMQPYALYRTFTHFELGYPWLELTDSKKINEHKAPQGAPPLSDSYSLYLYCLEAWASQHQPFISQTFSLGGRTPRHFHTHLFFLIDRFLQSKWPRAIVGSFLASSKKGVLTGCKGSVVGGSTKTKNVAESNPSEPSTKKNIHQPTTSHYLVDL